MADSTSPNRKSGPTWRDMTQEALQCRFEEMGISDHGGYLCDSSIPITSEHASECKTTNCAGGRRLRHEARCGLSSSTWP